MVEPALVEALAKVRCHPRPEVGEEAVVKHRAMAGGLVEERQSSRSFLVVAFASFVVLNGRCLRRPRVSSRVPSRTFIDRIDSI